MLILLPPSEGKAPPKRRGGPTTVDSLSFPELTETRLSVRDALIKLSGHPDALDALGVGASLAAEVEQNLRLAELPAMPAAQVYTGVLYDALDFAGLSVGAKRRAGSQVLVQSALWGPVRLRDKIAPYRLSMHGRLPGLGPLASVWRSAVGPVITGAAGRGVVVDCRSSTYAAAWQPDATLARRTVAVRAFVESRGKRTVVSHMAKHTRGLVARWLLEAERQPNSVSKVASIVSAHVRCELVDLGRKGFALDVIEDGP